MELHAGQKLWYVPNRRHENACEVTVSKVGRKWAELDPSYMGRIGIDTLCVDGGQYSSPGRCYLSREEYERELFLSTCWRDLCNDFERIRYGARPKNLGVDEMKQIRRILGLEIG